MIGNNNKTPLHKITDGNYFQEIVTEYFRSLKKENKDFHIADIDVEDSGIGPDGGADIVVDFHFEDAIGKHSHRWVVECKSQKKAVGIRDINTNNLYGIIESKKANGYLLVCINDASSGLKKFLKDNSNIKTVVWNGTHLWRKIIGSESILKAYFKDYYLENFINNNAKTEFNTVFEQFEKQIK